MCVCLFWRLSLQVSVKSERVPSVIFPSALKEQRGIKGSTKTRLNRRNDKSCTTQRWSLICIGTVKRCHRVRGWGRGRTTCRVLLCQNNPNSLWTHSLDRRPPQHSTSFIHTLGTAASNSMFPTQGLLDILSWALNQSHSKSPQVLQSSAEVRGWQHDITGAYSEVSGYAKEKIGLVLFRHKRHLKKYVFVLSSIISCIPYNAYHVK